MSAPSLAAGLLDSLIAIQSDDHNDRPAWPAWAEAFLVEFEAGRVRLTAEESAPGDEVETWPLVRWAQSYLYHHDQAGAGASDVQALRLFDALIAQTAPLQAWRARGQSLDYADWPVRRLDEELKDLLADQRYGDGHVWAGALSSWSAFMEQSVTVEFANEMLLTALASGDLPSAQAALDLGADPHAERDGILALGVPAPLREDKGLALINLLLAAGADPGRKSSTGQYPEEAWWQQRSRDDAAPAVPAPVARLREVAYPAEPLHRIEQVLAYLSEAEFKDRLQRAGRHPDGPWQGRSWAEWHMISLWQADGRQASDLERLQRLILGRSGNWQEKVTWQICTLNAQAEGQPEDAITPPVLWAQSWGHQKLTGPGLDALASWLTDQPNLPVRATWAAELMRRMVHQPEIALGQDPSGSSRYVAWLERMADPTWHTGATRQVTPLVSSVLFGPAESAAIWHEGVRLLKSLSPSEQGRAACAVLALMPEAWDAQFGATRQMWKADTQQVGLGVWLAHAEVHGAAQVEATMARWPRDLQEMLADPWQLAHPWIQAQQRAQDLAQRPLVPASPRARPRSRA